MEVIAVLLGLSVLAASIVIPIWALVLGLRSSKATREARANFELHRHRWELTEQRLARVDERLKCLEALAQSAQQAAQLATLQHAAAAANTDGAASSRQQEAAARVDVVSEESQAETNQFDDPHDADASANASPSAPSEAPDAEAPATPMPATRAPVNRAPATMNWESFIGVRLFSWLGGGALFLGAALFLHYSIQRNLISPPVRVALGLLAGALLLVGGDRLRVKAAMASQAIAGAGVGTLYASLYASRALYHLIPTPGAFAGMVLVTVTAGVVANRRNAYVLGMLGLVGGMATPFLLSTGEDRPWSLFAYVVLLDLGIVWLSRKREWPTLALVGFCASLLVFIAWCSQYLYSSRVPYALFAIALVAAIFTSLIRFKRTGQTEVDATVRAMAQFAVAVPMVVALVFVAHPKLHVSPAFLTVYLAVIAYGTVPVSQQLSIRYLPIFVAALAVLTQSLRVLPDIFPKQAVMALASFAILPAAHVGLWYWQRNTRLTKVYAWALGITLASPLVLASAASTYEPASAHFALAVYTALHVAGLLVLALVSDNALFLVLGQAVALVVEFALRSAGGNSMTSLWAVWLGASGLAFWALPLFAARMQRHPLALGAAALSLPLHFCMLYGFARDQWESGPLGLICVLGGIVMVFGLRRLRALGFEREKDRTAIMALHGAMGLGFLTAALPILFENQWLTVAFGLEVAALAWLRRRIAHDGLVLAATALATAALVRLLFNSWLWEYQPRSGIPILNYYLYTFVIVAVSFLYAAKQFSKNAFAREFRLCPLLKWSSVALLFVLVNIEVADYFSTGTTLVFRFSGGGLAQDMAYSLSWGCFALVLMGLGIVRRVTSLRFGALLFLSLTVLKVFLHDLWQLGALYRVGSVVGLAVALLAVSYLVQRFIFRGDKA